MGLIWSSVITSYLALFVNTYYSAGMINYSSKNQFLDMLPTFLSSGLMFVIITFILNNMVNYHLITQLSIGVMVGFKFYFLINRLFKAEPLNYLLTLLKEKRIV